MKRLTLYGLFLLSLPAGCGDMGFPYVIQEADIIRIEPDYGTRGVFDLNVEFLGENTHFGTTTRVSFLNTDSEYLKITSMTPKGSERFVITMDIDYSCPTGYKDIKVETITDTLQETIIKESAFLIR